MCIGQVYCVIRCLWELKRSSILVSVKVIENKSNRILVMSKYLALCIIIRINTVFRSPKITNYFHMFETWLNQSLSYLLSDTYLALCSITRPTRHLIQPGTYRIWAIIRFQKIIISTYLKPDYTGTCLIYICNIQPSDYDWRILNWLGTIWF